MKNLSKFKNQIFLYGIFVMILMEVISLPFLGFNIKYTYGLVLGTAIAIVNFNILTISSSWMLTGKNKFFASLSYLIRLLIYGGVFYIAMKTSYMAGLGSVLGFMTLKVSIFYIHGVKPGISRKKINKESNLQGTKRNILIKDPYMVRYCGKKTVMTHKNFIEYSKR